MKKKKLIITGIVVVAILGSLSIWSFLNNKKSYDIRITFPARSIDEVIYQEDFIYSDEEISPIGNKIKISSGKGLGDTEVVLKSIEVNEENAYEPTYLTKGMPVEMKVEKGAWFKKSKNPSKYMPKV